VPTTIATSISGQPGHWLCASVVSGGALRCCQRASGMRPRSMASQQQTPMQTDCTRLIQNDE
jgi:hypothetical protein